MIHSKGIYNLIQGWSLLNYHVGIVYWIFIINGVNFGTNKLDLTSLSRGLTDRRTIFFLMLVCPSYYYVKCQFYYPLLKWMILTFFQFSIEFISIFLTLWRTKNFNPLTATAMEVLYSISPNCFNILITATYNLLSSKSAVEYT